MDFYSHMHFHIIIWNPVKEKVEKDIDFRRIKMIDNSVSGLSSLLTGYICKAVVGTLKK